MATTDNINLSVMRGDTFSLPLVISLDQSRTLDGTEDWAFTARLTPTGPALLDMTKANGGIAIETVEGSDFQPVLKFDASRFLQIPIQDESPLVLKYDVQMTKDGNPETPIPRRNADGSIDEATISVYMDYTR